MSDISAFLASNYIWFLVAGIVLIFALIGYIVDSKNIVQDKPKTIKIDSEEVKEEKEVLENNVEIPVSKTVEPKPDLKADVNNKEVPNNKTEILETINLKDSAPTSTEPLIKEEIKTESTFQK